MRRKSIHLAVLIFQALWLNVIVPGHQRGIVQVPCASACEFCDPPSSDHHEKVPANKSETCAICMFAAHLSIPPTLDLTLPPLRFLHQLRAEIARQRIARAVIVPFDGRGPPVVA